MLTRLNLIRTPQRPSRKLAASTLCLLLFLLNAALNTALAESGHIKKVKTAAYKDIAVNITHTIGGVVPAAQDSSISAQISAIIRQFHVDTGYEVKKGDLLVTLDCKENRLRLQQAKANLDAEKAQLKNAVSQFRQAGKLNKQGNISKEIYNQREAEENRLKAMVENKKATLALAQINVNRCTIKAPFDGYITRRDASIGELTQIGTPLLQLISKVNDIVEVKINNRLLSSFAQGSNYKFVFNNTSYALKIKHILPILDKNTRNHIARLSFIDNHAITGSVGKVQWQDKQRSIPSSYIVLRDNKLGVLVAEGNTAKFIEIKTAIEGQPALVDMEDTAQIITTGRFNVSPGDAIDISN